MTTATTGTGTITLGAAVSGYLTFALAGVQDGETVDYAINDGSNSEIGTGTYTASGTTLTRTVTKSTNSNSAISLSGTAEVFISPRAETLDVERKRQNASLDRIYQSKLLASTRRGIGVWATGFKGANDTANGINTGSSSNYAVNSASGYAYPSVQKVVFVTSGTTWTVPSDLVSAKKIEVIGGGGSGGANGRGGGGGGAYARIDNVALTPGASVSIQVGAAGVWASNNGTTATATWMRIDGGSTAPTTTAQGVLAQPGQDGGDPTGGAGGSASTSVGTTKFSGGAGSAFSTYGGGGGGAAGPDANGGNGSTPNGGNGNGGLNGGGTGATTAVAGGNGTTWTATAGGTAGPGGGGRGGVAGNGTDGGAYGAGSGGGAVGFNQGAAKGGLIVVTYEAVPSSMTLVTDPQTSDSSVGRAWVLIEFDNSISPTLNTDLTVDVTCNGGTNWTAATLAIKGATGGGRYLAETEEIACTSGTSFAARIKTLNSKNVPIYGIEVEASP